MSRANSPLTNRQLSQQLPTTILASNDRSASYAKSFMLLDMTDEHGLECITIPPKTWKVNVLVQNSDCATYHIYEYLY